MDCAVDVRVGVVGLGAIIHTITCTVTDNNWEEARKRIALSLAAMKMYLEAGVLHGTVSIRTAVIRPSIAGRRLAEQPFRRNFRFKI
jgi:hypothetical protein